MCNSIAERTSTDNSLRTLHDASSHASYRKIIPIWRKLTGFKGKVVAPPCLSCGVAKIARRPVAKEALFKATHIISVVCIDVCFKMVKSPFGHIGFTHLHLPGGAYGETIAMKAKSQLTRIAIVFVVHCQRLHAPFKVIIIKADSELNTHEWNAFLRSDDGRGIEMQWTSPGVSKTNPVERAHYTDDQGFGVPAQSRYAGEHANFRSYARTRGT